MRIFSKCIFLFFSLLLLGCSFGNEDINQQLNTSEKVRKTGRVSGIVDRIKETKKIYFLLNKVTAYLIYLNSNLIKNL